MKSTYLRRAAETPIFTPNATQIRSRWEVGLTLWMSLSSKLIENEANVNSISNRKYWVNTRNDIFIRKFEPEPRFAFSSRGPVSLVFKSLYTARLIEWLLHRPIRENVAPYWPENLYNGPLFADLGRRFIITHIIFNVWCQKITDESKNRELTRITKKFVEKCRLSWKYFSVVRNSTEMLRQFHNS